jgi:hypothetical protein
MILLINDINIWQTWWINRHFWTASASPTNKPLSVFIPIHRENDRNLRYCLYSLRKQRDRSENRTKPSKKCPKTRRKALWFFKPRCTHVLTIEATLKVKSRILGQNWTSMKMIDWKITEWCKASSTGLKSISLFILPPVSSMLTTNKTLTLWTFKNIWSAVVLFANPNNSLKNWEIWLLITSILSITYFIPWKEDKNLDSQIKFSTNGQRTCS